ncbi:uncharacterized protein BCR38DRAFT_48599 [Pseudomassariella vexata]|uniref:Uncharacterized protein n=1 Tax=Pseudomassariella vexata TaxID=1141098 RepID=A0A1Y2DNU9_9PEZI|nr:uncharacterized protein BCR38DRAFT_48599 [Pseudomassariella vexata]ORY60887.1 hypothetical protein BCR38DRAFT_48599 [Pseudomassariella vexata]
MLVSVPAARSPFKLGPVHILATPSSIIPLSPTLPDLKTSRNSISTTTFFSRLPILWQFATKVARPFLLFLSLSHSQNSRLTIDLSTRRLLSPATTPLNPSAGQPHSALSRTQGEHEYFPITPHEDHTGARIFSLPAETAPLPLAYLPRRLRIIVRSIFPSLVQRGEKTRRRRRLKFCHKGVWARCIQQPLVTRRIAVDNEHDAFARAGVRVAFWKPPVIVCPPLDSYRQRTYTLPIAGIQSHQERIALRVHRPALSLNSPSILGRTDDPARSRTSCRFGSR